MHFIPHLGHSYIIIVICIIVSISIVVVVININANIFIIEDLFRMFRKKIS